MKDLLLPAYVIGGVSLPGPLLFAYGLASKSNLLTTLGGLWIASSVLLLLLSATRRGSSLRDAPDSRD